MKKNIYRFIALTIFSILFSSAALASQFCAGFEAGYITGYKQAKSTSMAPMVPMVPMCPMQPMKGFGDPESDYEHGYTIGFRKGNADGYN